MKKVRILSNPCLVIKVNVDCNLLSAAGLPRASTPMQQQTKAEPDVSNLKTMPKGLSASLPDLDSESWIEVKKRPRPSPARPKVSSEKVKFRAKHKQDVELKTF